MRKLEWFKFNPSDWMMGRISKMPIEVQGAYIRLCCIYWNKECNLSVKDAQLELLDVPEAYDKLVEYSIIKVDDKICIDFLDEQYAIIMDQKAVLSEAGKRGAKAKAKKRVGKGKAKGRLKVASADKDKDKEYIYREIEHLSITHDEYNRLCEEWHQADVDNVLDSIANYAGIDKYKSLNLTARNWLKDKPKIDSTGTIDTFADNVIKQMSK
jgi:hypothetical protein